MMLLTAALQPGCSFLGGTKGQSGGVPPCPVVLGGSGINPDYPLDTNGNLACQSQPAGTEEFQVSTDDFLNRAGIGSSLAAVDHALGLFNATGSNSMALSSATWLLQSPPFDTTDEYSSITMEVGFNASAENGLAFTQHAILRDPSTNQVLNVTCDVAFWEDSAAGGVATPWTTSATPGVIEWSLQSVLTHEIGHCVGFEHTDPVTFPSSVMTLGFITEGQAPVALSSDDVQAYLYLYP